VHLPTDQISRRHTDNVVVGRYTSELDVHVHKQLPYLCAALIVETAEPLLPKKLFAGFIVEGPIEGQFYYVQAPLRSVSEADGL
jgi:hypothetical protein